MQSSGKRELRSRTLSAKFAAYARGGLSQLASRAATYAGSFGSVWLLNRLLGKETYGHYLTAISVISIATVAGNLGLPTLVLYSGAKDRDVCPERAQDRFAAMLRLALWWSGLVSVLVALGSLHLPVLASKTLGGKWVLALAPLVFFRVGTNVHANWAQANLRFAERAALAAVLPNTLRVVLLSALALAGLRDTSLVAGVIVVSAALPVLVWQYRSRIGLIGTFGSLEPADLVYAGKAALDMLCSVARSRTAFILLAGFLGGGRVAEFGIALTLATLVDVGLTLTTPVLLPRVGALLGKGKHDEARREYGQVRGVSLGATLLAASVLVAGAHFALGLFGDYSASYAVLLLLVAATIVEVSFGMNGGLLQMGGCAGTLLVINTVMLPVNVLLCAFMIPQWGLVGAGAAQLVLYTTHNIIKATAARRLLSIRTVGGRSSLTATVSAAVLVCGALGVVKSSAIIAGVLAVLGVLHLVPSIRMMRHLLRGVSETPQDSTDEG